MSIRGVGMGRVRGAQGRRAMSSAETSTNETQTDGSPSILSTLFGVFSFGEERKSAILWYRHPTVLHDQQTTRSAITYMMKSKKRDKELVGNLTTVEIVLGIIMFITTTTTV